MKQGIKAHERMNHFHDRFSCRVLGGTEIYVKEAGAKINVP
ncbi:hypothetical protein HMPREF3213_02975 [Heyndrickxia coagulans]|uniref:Uncharacterized protein n=1 Tax=Heyndrickxia coagulans TaxID=1398 RepID=A0A133KFX1_HEYCO|nr:hypothetical protein HMPREF3213_02975 [Heyndrickxia coagulans]